MAIYVKKNRPIYCQPHYECKCHEILCSKIYSRFYNIYIFAVYRNPTADDTIYDCLLEQISKIQTNDPKASFIVCGDINAHHREWLSSRNTDSHGRSAFKFSTFAGLDQLITQPTHTSGNILDVVMTDVPGIVEAEITSPIGNSDHFGLSITVRVNQNIPDRTISKRIWLKNRANWDALRANAQTTISWANIFRHDNPVARLNEDLMQLCERHIPKKTIKFREKDKPWFNIQCRRAFHEKQTAFSVWRRHRTQENYEIFKNARQQATRTYAAAERAYNESLKTKLQQVQQPHLWWTKLKSSIFGSFSQIPPLLRDNGELATDPVE